MYEKKHGGEQLHISRLTYPCLFCVFLIILLLCNILLVPGSYDFFMVGIQYVSRNFSIWKYILSLVSSVHAYVVVLTVFTWTVLHIFAWSCSCWISWVKSCTHAFHKHHDALESCDHTWKNNSIVLKSVTWLSNMNLVWMALSFPSQLCCHILTCKHHICWSQSHCTKYFTYSTYNSVTWSAEWSQVQFWQVFSC